MAIKITVVCLSAFGMFLWRPALLEEVQEYENCIKTCEQVKDAEIAKAGSDINKFCQVVLNNNDCWIKCGAVPKYVEEITRNAAYFESCKLPFCAAGCTKSLKAAFDKLKLDQSSPSNEKMKICPHYETAFGCIKDCGYTDASLVKLKKEAKEICGADEPDDDLEDLKICATRCKDTFNAQFDVLNLNKWSPQSEKIKLCPHYETAFACFDSCGLFGAAVEKLKKEAGTICNVAPPVDYISVMRKMSKSAAIMRSGVCTQFLVMAGIFMNAMI